MLISAIIKHSGMSKLKFASCFYWHGRMFLNIMDLSLSSSLYFVISVLYQWWWSVVLTGWKNY